MACEHARRLVTYHDAWVYFARDYGLEAVTAETGVRYVGDLSDDVLPGEPGDPEHSYTELMRRNASRIVAALGGDPGALD